MSILASAGSRKRDALFITFVGCIFWASFVPVAKIGLDYISPILFSGLRFFIAGIILVGIFMITEKKKPHLDFVSLVISIIQIYLAYIFFFKGLEGVTGSFVSIVTGANPVFAMFFSVFLYGERYDRIRIAGIIAGITGIAMATFSDSNFNIYNMFYILLSSIFIGFGNSISKKSVNQIGPLALAGVTTLTGGALLLLTSPFMETPMINISYQSVIIIIYSSFTSIAGYVLFYTALRHNNVSLVTSVKFTIPPMGVIFSILLLSEKANILLVISIILVSLAILMINHASAISNNKVQRKTYIK